MTNMISLLRRLHGKAKNASLISKKGMTRVWGTKQGLNVGSHIGGREVSFNNPLPTYEAFPTSHSIMRAKKLESKIINKRAQLVRRVKTVGKVGSVATGIGISGIAAYKLNKSRKKNKSK